KPRQSRAHGECHGSQSAFGGSLFARSGHSSSISSRIGSEMASMRSKILALVVLAERPVECPQVAVECAYEVLGFDQCRMFHVHWKFPLGGRRKAASTEERISGVGMGEGAGAGENSPTGAAPGVS